MNEKDRSFITNQLNSIQTIGQLSDGYHTFDSLYYQRLVLFATIVNANKTISWKSRKHDDNQKCFDGSMFIVGIQTPQGQYTYHYDNEYWDLFECKELEKAPKWDGHTDKDVQRLLSLNKKRKQHTHITTNDKRGYDKEGGE